MGEGDREYDFYSPSNWDNAQYFTTISRGDARMIDAKDLIGVGPTCRRGEGFADNLKIEDNEISGRAVPYGHIIQLAPKLYEQFERGAFSKQLKDPARVKICLEHGQVVGRANSLEERDDGLWFRGRVSDNPGIPEAARANALIHEDLVDELSIGFQTVRDGTRVSEFNDGTLYTHDRARLLEVSLVPWGAYGREATLSRARFIDPDQFLVVERQIKAREWVAEFKRRGASHA